MQKCCYYLVQRDVVDWSALRQNFPTTSIDIAKDSMKQALATGLENEPTTKKSNLSVTRPSTVMSRRVNLVAKLDRQLLDLMSQNVALTTLL